MTNKDDAANKAAEKTKTSEATWPDFFAGLYNKLTGQNAGITYDFNDLNLYIPAKMGEDNGHFHWKVNGSLRVKTDTQTDSNNEEK